MLSAGLGHAGSASDQLPYHVGRFDLRCKAGRRQQESHRGGETLIQVPSGLSGGATAESGLLSIDIIAVGGGGRVGVIQSAQ